MICRRCGHRNEPGANFCSSCGAALPAEGANGPSGRGVDDTTASLSALEERHELDEELGDALADLPEGVGMVVVRRGPNAGSRFMLERETTALGRHPDSDIFLDDITVSRRHAVIHHAGGDYRIEDAGSLNGTYVNHERTERSPLAHLDELQIGRFVLTFLLGGSE